MAEGDVRRLREAGWSDRAIHDAAQVIAYFNYINRVADGLGVDLEPEMKPRS
jgi:alkylhydroperoxidase family enzyme